MISPQKAAWQRFRLRHLTGVMTGVTVTAMMITPGVAGAVQASAVPPPRPAPRPLLPPAQCDQP